MLHLLHWALRPACPRFCVHHCSHEPLVFTPPYSTVVSGSSSEDASLKMEVHELKNLFLLEDMALDLAQIWDLVLSSSRALLPFFSSGRSFNAD